jgi:hypothetical protein
MLAAKTQPADYLALYRQAFAEYKSGALWNTRAFDRPTREDALIVARELRLEGDMRARALAEEIERACLATH